MYNIQSLVRRENGPANQRKVAPARILFFRQSASHNVPIGVDLRPEDFAATPDGIILDGDEGGRVAVGPAARVTSATS